MPELPDAQVHDELTRLQRVLDAVSPPVCYLDSNFRYVYFNESYLRRLPFPPDEVRGQHVASILGQGLFEHMHGYLNRALGGESVAFEGRLPCILGTLRFTRLEFIPDFDGDKQVQGIIAILTDMHEQKELEQALREAIEHKEAQALQDSLTGLGNHRAFLERLAEAERAYARDASPSALLFFDVDSFKSFNDTFGHPAGDQVLRQVATLFKKEIRPGDLAARYGGEEFAVLLRGADETEAMHCAERLRCAVQDAVWPLRSVTVSGGIACFSTTTSCGASILQLADNGLYLAKKSGKNRVCRVSAETLSPTTPKIQHLSLDHNRKPAFA